MMILPDIGLFAIIVGLLTYNVVPFAFIVGPLTHNVDPASNIVANNVVLKSAMIAGPGYLCLQVATATHMRGWRRYARQ